jgi:uncharacterized protein
MRALLDVNVLVALFDPTHLHHEAAHRWFSAESGAGWASCPMTENGFVRVISHAAYPGNRATARDALARLLAFQRASPWQFWPDDISLVGEGVLVEERPVAHHQLTDLYLLALAVHHDGRLVSFDRKISLASVEGADARRLVVISPV